MSLPEFDVRTMPFSRRGSWLDLSPVVGLHDARDDIHLVSHQNGMHPIFRVTVSSRDSSRPGLQLTADPSRLRWSTADTTVEAAFESTDTVRFRGDTPATFHDAADGLTPFTGSYLFVDPIDGAAVLTSYETGRRYRVSLLAGAWTVTGDQLLGAGTRSVAIEGADGGVWEVAVEEFETTRPPYAVVRTFDDTVTQVADEYTAYADAIAPWRSPTDAGASAAYLLWSATVAPRGFVRREAILMSKHWMDKVWSWDHCFNALALASGLPHEALDQFLVVFDQQDQYGGLPDSVTHSEILDNYVKPPIHGWAFRQLRSRLATPLTREQLDEVHDRLGRWTTFWLDHRRVPGHALPHYQHGNDSGWDNSSIFDLDRVLEAPDLAAFLMIQLDVMAELSDELGRPAARWRDERQRVMAALMELREGDAFVGRHPLTGRESTATSLLNLMPIVAADALPGEVGEALADALRQYLTRWGLATERPDSELYEDDGYWRGPIWAPSTILIEDGLRRAGHTELADDVSERFRALCEASGFAENFDALSGAGLRDRAYTWTASAYLLLSAQAHERHGNAPAAD
ncbi:trehalase family glycosidase [soil metagenome]